MLLCANVQSQDDTTNEADNDALNILEGLTDSEIVQNNDALNDLEELGKVSKLTSGTTSRISHNWPVNNSASFGHYEFGVNN